ncbi:hypothetical protein FD30_GL002016 [Levilactobacillus namurensis DSM 19117]|uniref:Uncharacterized protein n=1 Tax=Levilactobacillus namurensis DSM 19117 TaxID=1423773 RepID=A0A0R1K467_9LACO|nr:hypothetical protein [Levilactobacillus namurensis]KRK75492.1 hypothetical protein FD30_GL002016 [Levilactobacillus namurensis DSM 19117]GEO75443.1 hypothetical protein LNA02_21410 [Levilactobacillus namurensis]
MKIIYPKLVEDAFAVANQHGQIAPGKENDVKAQIYQIMVDRGMLDELGEPTQLAINSGISGGLGPSSQLDSLAEFKRQFPIYGEFDDSHFKRLNGEWVADTYVIKAICQATLADTHSTPEQQVEAKAILRQIKDIQD